MQSGRWQRRCNCCENFLTASDKEKALKLKIKYIKCSQCNQVICRFCRENGGCHECNIKWMLGSDPNEMMKLSRVQLIAYLTILHYPKGSMDTWKKPYLVKQLLTRFDIHPDWNPESYTPPKGTAVTPTPSRPRTTPHLLTESAQWYQKTTGNNNNSPDEHIYDLPIIDPTQKNTAIKSEAVAPPKPKREPSLRRTMFVSVKDIPSADRFDAMSSSDLNTLLKQWVNDDRHYPNNAEDLRFILKYVWDRNQSRSESSLNDLQHCRKGRNNSRDRNQIQHIDIEEGKAGSMDKRHEPENYSEKINGQISTSNAASKSGKHPQHQQPTSSSAEQPGTTEEQELNDPPHQLSELRSPKLIGRPITMLSPSSELQELQKVRNNLKSVSKKLP